MFTILANQFSGIGLAAGQRYLNRPRVLNHMSVGQDMALLVDHRTRSGAVARDASHEKRIDLLGLRVDVHHASIGHFVDPNVGLLLRGQRGWRRCRLCGKSRSDRRGCRLLRVSGRLKRTEGIPVVNPSGHQHACKHPDYGREWRTIHDRFLMVVMLTGGQALVGVFAQHHTCYAAEWAIVRLEPFWQPTQTSRLRAPILRSNVALGRLFVGASAGQFPRMRG